MPRLALAAILVALSAAPVLAGNGGCPPGLAKKSPACIPPGLAKKAAPVDHDYVYVVRIGDRIDDRYVYIDNPYRYGLDPDYFYYRLIDKVFRVDPETRRVLTLVGLADALLN